PSRREFPSGSTWEAVAPSPPTDSHRRRLTVPLLGIAATITGALAAGLVMLLLPSNVISTVEIPSNGSNAVLASALEEQSLQVEAPEQMRHQPPASKVMAGAESTRVTLSSNEHASTDVQKIPAPASESS